LAITLKHLGGILGLLQDSPQAYLQSDVGPEQTGMSNEGIQTLIDQRNQARKAKDFAEGDRIRDLLAENGVSLEDTSDGTIWRRN
jgi:cysteinyl-tRNA synthetase